MEAQLSKRLLTNEEVSEAFHEFYNTAPYAESGKTGAVYKTASLLAEWDPIGFTEAMEEFLTYKERNKEYLIEGRGLIWELS